MIALFPADTPLRFLNLNVTAGRTGVGFDRRARAELAPGETFDLQVCLEGRDGATAVVKEELKIGTEVQVGRGGFEIPGRLRWADAWPAATIELRDADLELDVALVPAPERHAWARIPGLYTHVTAFVSARIVWRWRGARGEVTVPALHDLGRARRLPAALGGLLRGFRYEVLRLPGDRWALGLRATGPGGVAWRAGGVIGPGETASRFAVDGLTWDICPNHAGVPCRLPRRWRAQLGPLAYTAERASPPRAILGDGFLCAADFETADGVRGESYVESFGRASRA